MSSAMSKLTPKQAAFVREYLVDLNATAAGLRAGYSHGMIGRRLMTVPGIGPLIATAIAVLAPPSETFHKARDLAAWLGLVPRQHSTGGKQRLGATTKMGERSLRRLLIIGANSIIIKRHVHAAARPGTWLGGMLTRKPPMLVRVALANKMARIVWALMARGGVYQSQATAA